MGADPLTPRVAVRRPQRVTAGVVYRAVLLAFGLAVLLLVFPHVVGLLLLVMLVVIIAMPLARAATGFERLRVPRAVAAPLILLAVLSLIVLAISLLAPTFAAEGRQLVDTLPKTVQSLRREIGRATHAQPTQTGESLQTFVRNYTDHPSKLLGPATTVGAGVAGFVTGLVLVIVTALFIAIQPRPLVDGAVRLVAPERRDHARHILQRLAHSYTGWLRGLALGMAVLFVITYVGLTLVGLPYALVWSSLTAVAMVVPYFGALFSAVPPVLLGLTISPGTALLVVAVYIVSHLVEGHIVEPLVMARAVKLHPAFVAVGIFAVERLLGVAGLVVAVPILVTAKILVEELWVYPREAAVATARAGEERLGQPVGSSASTPR